MPCSTAAIRTVLCTPSAVMPALRTTFSCAAHARPATIDRGDCQRIQLEVGLVDAGIADDIHPQLGRQLAVLGVLDEMHEAVVDVVHAHDRGRGARSGDVLGVERLPRERLDLADENGIAGGDCRRERNASDLSLVESRRALAGEHRRQIQAQILGVLGNQILDVRQIHVVHLQR